MDVNRLYREASTKTATNLRTVVHSPTIRELAQLPLPEIDAVVDTIARVIPAGNVPAMILSGLARLSGRAPSAQRDINLLFRGVEQTLDRVVYATMFAGPAAVIWGYQNLLRLVGKKPEDAFPEGTWQFYAGYALREDTARHTNETHGFDTRLNRHQIHLAPVDRMTAWTMTAIHCLHHYDALLENEWRERVMLSLLRELTRDEPDAAFYARLYREWERQRPYSRRADSDPHTTYPHDRRLRFDAFLESATRDLPGALRQEWQERCARAEKADLPAYQRQMTIAAHLDPGPYGETRTPLPLPHAHIGIIIHKRYHLVPVCRPGTAQPAPVETVRAQIAAILAASFETPSGALAPLARIKRSAGMRQKLNETLVTELDALRTAPILLNFDRRPRHLPLSELRQAERGIGDHALTIFDTGETFVFDQSHIFFDGAWGAALAEILTNEALSWAVYLNGLSPARPGDVRPYSPAFRFTPADLERIRQAPCVTPEVSAETDRVDLRAILRLRRLMQSRSSLLRLTVNDLLVLYRAIHAVTYRAQPALVNELNRLARHQAARQPARMALDVLDPAGQTGTAILIPVDASLRSPRDRLYPMTFEIPLDELNLLALHARVLAALNAYQQAEGERGALYADFAQLQRTYLATLAGFGAVLAKAKEIAITGQSASASTIKLLAYMPAPLQRLLDRIPDRFDILNDLLKGREVFSNVGAVAPSSSLLRFTTAKDDNDKKSLVWGVITDAAGIIRISLRDFRPYVRELEQCGHRDFAVQMVEDYLDAYVQGLNLFISDLHRITQASRETHLELDDS